MSYNDWNTIELAATDSEWKEILAAFSKGLIDWPLRYSSMDFGDSYKSIDFALDARYAPYNTGVINPLTKLYPTVIFHYIIKYEGGGTLSNTYYCNGEEGKLIDVKREQTRALNSELSRFTSASTKACEGISHHVEIMPDGCVTSDGENKFGECNTFRWTNIKQISCGNCHTVGLKDDGTVVACGSNVNGQCEVSDIEEPAVAVSCGRYHTAILLESGKVIVKGNLEQEADFAHLECGERLKPKDFPIIARLKLDCRTPNWQNINERIEKISVGEELKLKKVRPYCDLDGESLIRYAVLDMDGMKLGNIRTDFDGGIAKTLDSIKVYVNTVKPLSQRSEKAKYATMTIRIEYVEPDSNLQKKISRKIGCYEQTRVSEWTNVVKIKSIYDAVVGVTSDGTMLVDGYCPCSTLDLMKIVGVSDSTSDMKKRRKEEESTKYRCLAGSTCK